ncbi:MAG: DNA-packaging protein [Sphingomicrobium sp.]
MDGGQGRRAVAALEDLAEEDIRLALRSLSEGERRTLEADWPSWAHAGQTPPDDSWRVWVLLAGRGFGKTRAGAEWVMQQVREWGGSPPHPLTASRRPPRSSARGEGLRIALISATADEARAVMVEGRSGLLAVARADDREAMRWEPSRRLLTFANGAQAFVYSAANPESLRGPEHHLAWCDELAKWRRGQAAWDNLLLGVRLGERPRILVTTTPKPVAVVRHVLALGGTVLTGGATRANPHLGEDFIDAVEAAHKGTRFGRQELEGKLLDDVEGALWTRALIERCRILPGTGRWQPEGLTEGRSCHAPEPLHHSASLSGPPPPGKLGEELRRIVVGVDPPASVAGTCGIVVCAMGADGIAYVLADASAGGLSPEGWARRVAGAAEAWAAHRVVAEKNNGGAMVGTVLRGADAGLPVTLVHAADGKAARAEPVAVLFEAGKAKFAGAFPELEDELAGFTPEGWRGAGASPDRADAMIWAMTELAVKPRGASPRIRGL